MKTNKTKKIITTFACGLMPVLFVGLALWACTGNEHKNHNHNKTEHGGEKAVIEYYTCSMHPQIRQDKPGDCPICNMRLNPVYKEGGAPESRGDRPVAPTGVVIPPERQQLIGVKTEVIQKKSVTKEIRTVGRVAYDPDLAIAQKEYIEISKNIPSLKKAARSRLRLLGMSEEEIRELDAGAGSKPAQKWAGLYLPEPGESVWVYATLYQEEFESVKPGMSAVISLPSGRQATYAGTVRAVDPIVDPMTRSARARIEVAEAGGVLRPDTYVNVSIKIDLGEALTVPKSALIDTGARRVVFVVHEGRHFQSRDVKTGSETGDDVVILEGIKEGEIVVASAAFLVDSESQLKAAIAGMGEHQH